MCWGNARKGLRNPQWNVCKRMSIKNATFQEQFMSIYFRVCCANSYLFFHHSWMFHNDYKNDVFENQSEKDGGIFTSRNIIYKQPS